MTKISIKLCDGKYKYIRDKDGQRALRYEEQWRDLTGDGFILAMAQEIERLTEIIENNLTGLNYEKSCEITDDT